METKNKITFLPSEESILRKYNDSNFFIDRAKNKIISSSIIYSTSCENIKKIIINYPQFANLNHSRVLENLTNIYSIKNVQRLKTIVLGFPQFANLNHSRVLENLIEIYNIENTQRLKKIILSFPQFTGYNHLRVLKDMSDAYKIEDKEIFKNIILKSPQFAGINHYRVLKQKSKLGKLIGLDYKKVKEILLSNSNIAWCSYHRDLAIFDILNELHKEGFEVTERQVLSNFTLSPYVPNTTKLRIGRARKLNKLIEMPPMYIKLRRLGLRNQKLFK